MKTETLRSLKEAAEVYLETRPDHPYGFCLWLGLRWDESGNPDLFFDLAYWVVSPFFNRYADIEETHQRAWVDAIPGPTQRRLKFVRWLLDEVTAELNSTPEEG